ncbi:MAG: xanthine dehydrogenase accessory protein XdhC [Steroidobacteraceae bacterium]
MSGPPTALSPLGGLAAHSGSGFQPNGWLAALMRALQCEPVVVRIVLAAVRGSAPREAGVGMLVTQSGIVGTIGGGRLEWEALAAGRDLLEGSGAAVRMQRIVLGADLGQCCGGVVDVWMERYTRADLGLLKTASLAALRGAAVLTSTPKGMGAERRIIRQPGTDPDSNQLLRLPCAQAVPRLRRNANGDATLLERLDDALPPLWLYGAGHVGRALARILMELPLRLTWVDSRAEQFPAQRPATVEMWHCADPVASVAAAPPGARFLVMTHSHPLDYALCRTILERNDFAWAGLIGSMSKAARFRSRLARDGVGAAAAARLVCPIGIDGITSKWPAAIAVGVAAQVMQDISAGVHAGRQGHSAAPIVHDCPRIACSSCGSREC